MGSLVGSLGQLCPLGRETLDEAGCRLAGLLAFDPSCRDPGRGERQSEGHVLVDRRSLEPLLESRHELVVSVGAQEQGRGALVHERQRDSIAARRLVEFLHCRVDDRQPRNRFAAQSAELHRQLAAQVVAPDGVRRTRRLLL
ncbi:MAG: hypothetical protein ACRDNE_15970, partial [Gaiellaceae bacterium]